MSVTFPSGVVPVTNATLTAVKGGGFSENYDLDASGDVTRWSGTQDVWVGEELRTDASGRTLDQVSVAYMAIRQSLGTGVQRGDAVFFTHKGAPNNREVDDIREYDLVGMTRIYFTDE